MTAINGQATGPARVGHAVFAFGLTTLWITVATAAFVAGAEYYVTPLQERAFSALHETFAPAAPAGNAFGIVGSAMILVGVALYSLRKRLRPLFRIGRLNLWLQIHIFLCTLGPFLVLLHTSFKFGGIVSIAFWSMALVVASGVFGRYVYAHIPKTINGQFVSLRALQQEKDDFLAALAARTDLSPTELAAISGSSGPLRPRGFVGAFFLALRYDLAGRFTRRRITRLLRRKGVPRHVRHRTAALLHQQRTLERQIVLLHPFQQMFKFWHLFHLPLAILMFVIMIGHVAIAVLFGYAWAF